MRIVTVRTDSIETATKLFRQQLEEERGDTARANHSPEDSEEFIKALRQTLFDSLNVDYRSAHVTLENHAVERCQCAFFATPTVTIIVLLPPATMTQPVEQVSGMKSPVNQDHDCIVCLFPVVLTEPGSHCVLPCGHAYHQACIRPWISHRKYTDNPLQCPRCSHDIAGTFLAENGLESPKRTMPEPTAQEIIRYFVTHAIHSDSVVAILLIVGACLALFSCGVGLSLSLQQSVTRFIALHLLGHTVGFACVWPVRYIERLNLLSLIVWGFGIFAMCIWCFYDISSPYLQFGNLVGYSVRIGLYFLSLRRLFPNNLSKIKLFGHFAHRFVATYLLSLELKVRTGWVIFCLGFIQQIMVPP